MPHIGLWSKAIDIFDRTFYKLQRKRGSKNFHKHDFLFRLVSEDVADRAKMIVNHFGKGLLYGTCYNNFPINEIIRADLLNDITDGQNITFDEEDKFPFQDGSFDFIFTNLSLHFVNDIQKALFEYGRCLKKGGVFIATMFAGKTLIELRKAAEDAEMLHQGKVSPRIIPFIDIKDAGMLMKQSGFAEPIADIQNYSVEYNSVYSMMKDIKGMGQSNCLTKRNKIFCSKHYFDNVEQLYPRNDGKMICTFSVLTLTGYK